MERVMESGKSFRDLVIVGLEQVNDAVVGSAVMTWLVEHLKH